MVRWGKTPALEGTANLKSRLSLKGFSGTLPDTHNSGPRLPTTA